MGSCGLDSREEHPERQPKCLPHQGVPFLPTWQVDRTCTLSLPQPSTQGDKISTEGDR